MFSLSRSARVDKYDVWFQPHGVKRDAETRQAFSLFSITRKALSRSTVPSLSRFKDTNSSFEARATAHRVNRKQLSTAVSRRRSGLQASPGPSKSAGVAVRSSGSPTSEIRRVALRAARESSGINVGQWLHKIFSVVFRLIAKTPGALDTSLAELTDPAEQDRTERHTSHNYPEHKPLNQGTFANYAQGLAAESRANQK